MSYDSKIIVFVLVLFLCATITGRADDKVDRYIEARIRSLDISGVSLAVVRNGRVIKAKGYGLANIETNSKAAPNTVYEIGSITKQFTAVAVMMLVEEGKINLDEKITKYFAEAPAAWNKITVRHLLNHTSGIQNHVAVPGFMGVFKTNLFGETTPTHENLVKEFFKLPQEFEPGETWAYDNGGYILLGLIIEKESGKSYFQFLDERIFKPLEMTATRSTETKSVVPQRASGCEWVNGKFENRPVLLPATGNSFLMSDAARFSALHSSRSSRKKTAACFLRICIRITSSGFPISD